jgi:glycosyltransferase involved in cell wall biosynthesis
VRFEPILPSGAERMMKQDRLQIHLDLRRAVQRFRPDYVLLPSGDLNTAMMGLFRASGMGGLPGRIPGEIGVHFGWGAGALTRKERLRDELHAWQLSLAGWRRVHVVNHLFYEWIQARGGALARRCDLLPHPVQPNRRVRDESRARLGLPIGGRILGVAGVIDRRKAVKELLDAFRAAALEPTDRVLLAGPLTASHRQTLSAHYQDLLADGRLLVLDRFFDANDTQDALSAMDIVCAPYPGFSGLSSVLLEGLAAGRPLLSNRRGWCQMIVERFQAGWTCTIEDHRDFTKAIQTAFEGCESYRPSDATARLLAFHSPDNFARSFLRGVREWAGVGAGHEYRSWSWVTDALTPPARS